MEYSSSQCFFPTVYFLCVISLGISSIWFLTSANRPNGTHPTPHPPVFFILVHGPDSLLKMAVVVFFWTVGMWLTRCGVVVTQISHPACSQVFGQGGPSAHCIKSSACNRHRRCRVCSGGADRAKKTAATAARV
jgi:hypothetical protein